MATTDEEGQSIRLMSIHQAKGLEFPIVVLPDLNRRQEQGRGSVVFHSELGPLVRLTKASAVHDPDITDTSDALGWKTYRTLEKVEEDAEALRIFYVATTRARDFLLLSSGDGSDAKPQSIAMRLLDERFDRTNGICRAALPNEWGIPAIRITTLDGSSRSENPRATPQRPDLLEVADTITSAQLESIGSISRRVSGPRFIDLSSLPKLSPRAARFDRLIQTILSDPAALGADAETLGDLAQRQAGASCLRPL